MEQENNKKEMGLEERFAAIELILDQMEDENVTLDESFELYKKGMEQMKAANQALDQIEKAMLVMNESGELEEF
ncbi:MAG: exodeoxyribonuclease VII small subunit [Lachnobacterium sp.]|jgi:exodeoxyribonuclease VII small subunit|nr:exodeoxyribonuclease VII small subunit [Lachnobacterium sp.]MEE0595423.1 exodeoxyribonuclease VII small subunit [Agathobacter sp.]